MPYANIRITKTGTTAAQKAAVIKGVTDLLVKILGKDPASTFVVIDEVETDNWGIAGESITARRATAKRQAAGRAKTKRPAARRAKTR